MQPINPQEIIAVLIVIFFGIGIHEYAHCKLADAAGDPTPRYYGRVTLNLFKHFDVVGAIMILVTVFYGYGIGWGKPAPMDPRKMRNPRWDFFAAVAAGPISNFLQAAVYAFVIRIIFATGQTQLIADQAGGFNFLGILLLAGVYVNLRLMFFNLIPLGPLDGHWLLGLFLPEPARYAWNKWNLQMGTYILFGIIFLGQMSGRSILGMVLNGPSDFVFQFLTGLR
jgi:Zn-dependent protease